MDIINYNFNLIFDCPFINYKDSYKNIIISFVFIPDRNVRRNNLV